MPVWLRFLAFCLNFYFFFSIACIGFWDIGILLLDLIGSIQFDSLRFDPIQFSSILFCVRVSDVVGRGRERNLQQSKEREAVPALWFSYLRKGVFTEGKRFGNCFVLERGDVCYIDSVVSMDVCVQARIFLPESGLNVRMIFPGMRLYA